MNKNYAVIRDVTFSEVSESGFVDLQILKTVTLHDPRYGKVGITKGQLDTMVKNFNEDVRGIKIMLDAGHNSDKESYGWFKSLSVKLSDDGKSYELWAKVELTPLGQKALTEKTYGYISADFDPAYVDNETLIKHGAVLLGAALTNRPVVKRMKSAIELSENIMDMPELLAQLGVSSVEELISMVASLKSKETELSAMPTQLSEKNTELEAVKIKLAEVEATLAKSAKDNEFNLMLSEGTVVEAQRESFAKGDMTEFAKNAGKVKLVTLSEDGNKEPKEETAQAKIMKLAEKKMEVNKSLTMTAAIANVLSEEKELNEEYKKETQGVL